MFNRKIDEESVKQQIAKLAKEITFICDCNSKPLPLTRIIAQTLKNPELYNFKKIPKQLADALEAAVSIGTFMDNETIKISASKLISKLHIHQPNNSEFITLNNNLFDELHNNVHRRRSDLIV